MTNKLQIKIALAIDSDGNWGASGWGNLDGCATDQAMEIALECLDEMAEVDRRYFIELEREVPEAPRPDILRAVLIVQEGEA